MALTNSDYKDIPIQALDTLYDQWATQFNCPRERYLAKDEAEYIAIDNRGDEFIIEGFKTKEEAVAWLKEPPHKEVELYKEGVNANEHTR